MKKSITILGAIIVVSLINVGCGSEPTNKDANENTTTEQAVANEPMSKKKELMTKLIGEHSLKSISGFMGANTMVDYLLENGKWSASGSSNSGGMREGYDVTISKKDLEKLKSMKIVVAENLSVSFLCDGKSYFETPFKEDGMNYLLEKAPKDFNSDVPKNLESSTTFLDNYLFFYAKDKVAEGDIKFSEFVGVMADAVMLKYNTTTNEFELVLFYGDCCDSSTYLFK